jgi:ribosome-binding protein aMBF1 (putative translation factor)
MIKNDKQLANTKAELKEFEEALNAIKPSKKDDLRAKMHQNALKATTENLSREIKEYELLKNGNTNFIPVKDFYDITKALIKARIAKGWTQTDLARKMEIDVQQIQRYEARDYEGASIERIQEAIDALEIDVNINVIVVPKTHNQAQEKVFQNQALFSFA